MLHICSIAATVRHPIVPKTRHEFRDVAGGSEVADVGGGGDRGSAQIVIGYEGRSLA